MQKIGRLEVDDKLSGLRRQVVVSRDKENDLYAVESDEQTGTFITYRYTQTVPAEVVRTRFPGLDEDLDREVILAIPKPTAGDGSVARSGRLFCFLPTEVKTGTPVHLQIDAKTSTDRENILDFNRSEWNRCIFSRLNEEFIKMYIGLVENSELAERLPEVPALGHREPNHW